MRWSNVHLRRMVRSAGRSQPRTCWQRFSLADSLGSPTDGRSAVPTRLLLPLSVVAVLLLAACSAAPAAGAHTSPSGEGLIRVLTSTSMWAAVARAVGGDAVSVTALLDQPGRDPH